MCIRKSRHISNGKPRNLPSVDGQQAIVKPHASNAMEIGEKTWQITVIRQRFLLYSIIFTSKQYSR